MRANIIGAGIAGPMAAITLASEGYEVHAYDNRAEADLHSDGVLGITDASWEILTQHHVTGAFRRELPNGGDTYHYLVWTDLHRSLVERAEQLGAVFHYGESFAGEMADLTVYATGVGSAKDVTRGVYTGYVIIRGLAYQFSGSSWTAIRERSAEGEWLFTAGDTRDGTSIMMLVPRKNVTMRTTYSQAMPPEAGRLSLRWCRLLESVPMFQIAPMSDWDVPAQMITEHEGHAIVRLGDANGQLRPQTSQGANRAIEEGADKELLVVRSREAEAIHLAARQALYEAGIKIGIYPERPLSKV